MIDEAQRFQIPQIAGTLRELLADALTKKDLDTLAVGLRKRMGEDWGELASRITVLEEETKELHKTMLADMISAMRESLAEVPKSGELVQHFAGLTNQLRSICSRVDTLETGAEAKKEGLRGRMDRLSTKLNVELGGLLERLREVEAVVFEENDDGFGKQDAMTDADTKELERRKARCMDYFRESLSVGMKVHLSGLESRPGLNGKAAVLTAWHAESQRWAALVDEEQVRVKLMHIVP
jgi:hypothetical protein